MLAKIKKWLDPKEKQKPKRLIQKTLKGQHAEKAMADLNGEPWVGKPYELSGQTTKN